MTAMVPPISAEGWLTMDEALFRAIVTSSATVLMSRDAYNAMRQRAAALGIEMASSRPGNEPPP